MDRNRWIRLAAVVFLVLLLSVELAACSSIPGTTQGKPQIKIISPSTGAQVQAGQDVSVQSMATDPNGVKKVELWVDQVLVRADELAAQNAGSAAPMAVRSMVVGSNSATGTVRAEG